MYIWMVASLWAKLPHRVNALSLSISFIRCIYHDSRKLFRSNLNAITAVDAALGKKNEQNQRYTEIPRVVCASHFYDLIKTKLQFMHRWSIEKRRSPRTLTLDILYFRIVYAHTPKKDLLLWSKWIFLMFNAEKERERRIVRAQIHCIFAAWRSFHMNLIVQWTEVPFLDGDLCV